MKTKLHFLIIALLGLSFVSVPAQPGGRGGMGGPPKGPSFSGAMTKLFGDQSAFSANLEFQVKEGKDTITMPGKMAFDQGKTRFEVDMTQMKGSKMSAGDAEGMKAMGMDSMVIISRPDKKISYMVFSGMSAYVESALKDNENPEVASKYKSESTELGKETIDGHACIKNKVVVTDDKDVKHESTVWNATDLKKFPIKIETTEDGKPIIMLFKDVKLAKPDASVFAPPADFKQYPDMMSLMQQEMMKRMGGGFPPPPTLRVFSHSSFSFRAKAFSGIVWSMGKRREARERAVQFLFQHDLNPPEDIERALNEFWDSQRAAAIAEEKAKANWNEPVTLPPPSAGEAETRLFSEPLIRGALQYRNEADQHIQKHVKNYELHRIAAVDRNILRLAIYEMLHREDIPPVVSINEAVDIAKKFSTEDSGKFVNGILDKVKGELMRPARNVK